MDSKINDVLADSPTKRIQQNRHLADKNHESNALYGKIIKKKQTGQHIKLKKIQKNA